MEDLEQRRPFVSCAACPGSTVTRAGTSPDACREARVLTPSEITPIPMPVPLTL